MHQAIASSSRAADVDVVGQVDVADLLLGDPAVAHLVVGVTGVEGGVDACPAGFVDPLGAEEQQLADVVERVALPAAVLEGLLLDPVAAAGDGLVGEAHDVERVDHDGHLGQRAGPAGDGIGVEHRGPVALVGVDGHDLDHRQPRRGHRGHPRPQMAGRRGPRTRRGSGPWPRRPRR